MIMNNHPKNGICLHYTHCDLIQHQLFPIALPLSTVDDQHEKSPFPKLNLFLHSREVEGGHTLQKAKTLEPLIDDKPQHQQTNNDNIPFPNGSGPRLYFQPAFCNDLQSI